MSYKPIKCPRCGAMLRSKYEVRSDEDKIRRWRWLRWCPVCGAPLRVVFGDPWNQVKGVVIDGDR